jgi:hypothetical protein
MFGTAAWFVIFGGAVLAAGLALWTGRRWGRGVAVFAQLLLLPVAWYLGVGSGRWIYGIGVAVGRAHRAGAVVQPVGRAVAERSGFGFSPERRQLRARNPIGDPLVHCFPPTAS